MAIIAKSCDNRPRLTRPPALAVELGDRGPDDEQTRRCPSSPNHRLSIHLQLFTLNRRPMMPRIPTSKPAKNASSKRVAAAVKASADAENRSPAAEIGSHAGDPNYMASLARGLAVIRGFSQQRARMSIAQ